jgi:GNAT superfamily N-acetyltransferase
MIIRPAQPDDAAAACEVLRRSITELCERDHGNDGAFLARWLSNKTPQTMSAWIAGSHVFVAEENGAILGVAAVSNKGFVTLNYVSPDARFRGVSKSLLRALEAKAGELGLSSCSPESTKTAERFYRAAGYRERDGVVSPFLVKKL